MARAQGKHREFRLYQSVATLIMSWTLPHQGDHAKGRTRNLDVNFSRQGKHKKKSRTNKNMFYTRNVPQI